MDEVDETPRFHVPRRGEMTSVLRHGIDSLKAGELSAEEFVHRLERASQNVPDVFAGIFSQLESEEQEESEYLAGVMTSLADCQALFQNGIDEMLRFTETGEEFHLRFGWLLVEKGEEEYIRIAETLGRDATGGEFSGRQDVLGQLAAELREGRLDQESYGRALDRFQAFSDETVDRASQLIQEAVKSAREFDGRDNDAFFQASEKAAQAADEIGGLLLSLYHP